MKRERYTLWGGEDGTDLGLPDITVQTTVYATCHRQHIWNETRLCGVSARTEQRIRKLFGDRLIFCDATPWHPRVIGFERA